MAYKTRTGAARGAWTWSANTWALALVLPESLPLSRSHIFPLYNGHMLYQFSSSLILPCFALLSAKSHCSKRSLIQQSHCLKQEYGARSYVLATHTLPPLLWSLRKVSGLPKVLWDTAWGQQCQVIGGPGGPDSLPAVVFMTCGSGEQLLPCPGWRKLWDKRLAALKWESPRKTELNWLLCLCPTQTTSPHFGEGQGPALCMVRRVGWDVVPSGPIIYNWNLSPRAARKTIWEVDWIFFFSFSLFFCLCSPCSLCPFYHPSVTSIASEEGSHGRKADRTLACFKSQHCGLANTWVLGFKKSKIQRTQST